MKIYEGLKQTFLIDHDGQEIDIDACTIDLEDGVLVFYNIKGDLIAVIKTWDNMVPDK